MALCAQAVFEQGLCDLSGAANGFSAACAGLSQMPQVRRAAWHKTLLKNGGDSSNAANPLLQRDGSVRERIKR